MSRTTQKMAYGMFKRLAKAMNKKVGHYKKVGKGKNARYPKVFGAWEADYNSAYGGWSITEILRSGGVTNPLGMFRMSTKEFYQACWLAARAIESRKRKR